MSVIIIAVATESGVPIFSRKRGSSDGVQFSTIASLHGINMFSKCHNLSMLATHVDNGRILWKEYCKSVTLIGIATGGLECELELLLSCVHDVMVFYIGKKELESLKNIDQIKRDLRQCYPILDYLLESLDPNAVSSPSPTLVLDLMQSILCPQAQQLQQVLDQYALSVSGRWAFLTIHGHVAATSSDFTELDPREARLLQLLAATQDGAPLRETPVYLPQMSPHVAFRAVTCKLLADVYAAVVIGASPPLSELEGGGAVLRCWQPHAHTIKAAQITWGRNLPTSIHFDNCVLGVLVVNIASKRCVFSNQLHASSRGARASTNAGAGAGAHTLDILRTFYVTATRDLAPELRVTQTEQTGSEELLGLTETYWCSDYHNCHGQRAGNLLCCVLYSATVPTHTMRLMTTQILQELNTNKDVHW